MAWFRRKKTCFFCKKEIKTKKPPYIEYKHADGTSKAEMCNKCANKLEDGRLNDQRPI